jgi:hypothetical protein
MSASRFGAVRKAVFFIVLISMAVLLKPALALAVEDNCNVGDVPKTFSYLNPPADPTQVTPGTLNLGNLLAQPQTQTYATFTIENTLTDQNSLTSYFFFFSADGGSSWSCERSYTRFSSTQSLEPDTDYVAIAIASNQTLKAISTVAKFSTKKQPVVLCAPDDATLRATFYNNLNQFALNVDSMTNLSMNQRLMRYTVEVTIDNWRTKGTYRDYLQLSGAKYFPVVKPNVEHVFRLIPRMDDKLLVSTKGSLVKEFISTGCKILQIKVLARDTRSDCDKNPNQQKCEITFSDGENAGQVAVGSKKTLICVKGSLTKKVVASKPKCPVGYRKK